MFGINPQDREVYPRNFIRSVYLRATYPSTQQCSSNRERFLNLFADIMPKVDDTSAVKIELNNKGNKIETDENAHRLVLHSNDMQKEMTFANEECAYTVSGLDYKDFEDVSKQYQKALFFAQTCGVHTLSSLTLRKVNVVQFKGETAEDNALVPIHGALSELIGKELLFSYEARKSINPFIKQSMQSIVLKDQDYELTIKYGVEALRRENNNKRLSGVVVIDLMMRKNQVTMDSLKEELTTFNNEIFNAFRWTLSDAAIKLLRGQNGI